MSLPVVKPGDIIEAARDFPDGAPILTGGHARVVAVDPRQTGPRPVACIELLQDPVESIGKSREGWRAHADARPANWRVIPQEVSE